MPDLFRVFPYVAGAALLEPGGALYAFRGWQGWGRIDNPEQYGVLYLATTATAAVAERLQGFSGRRLTSAHLRTPVFGRRGKLALARFSAHRERECDLDHPVPLLERDLVPSDIATRDRTITQELARGIWQEGRWGGVRFWSALEAKWPIVGRWSIDDLVVEDVEELTLLHQAVREAAEFLAVEVGR